MAVRTIDFEITSKGMPKTSHARSEMVAKSVQKVPRIIERVIKENFWDEPSKNATRGANDEKEDEGANTSRSRKCLERSNCLQRR